MIARPGEENRTAPPTRAAIVDSHTITPCPPDFLRGVIAPMLTPVRPDGRIDYPAARSMVVWLVSLGCVRTIFVRSGMGRMYSFTVDEAQRLAETVIEAASGRAGVIVGCAGEWRERESGERPDPERYMDQAIELTQYAERAGADGAMHVVPEALVDSGGGAAEETICRYSRAVHDASRVPIVLYQPGGLPPECRLTPRLLCRLLELPRIAGMKLSTADDAIFRPIAEVVVGSRFALICGHEGYYLRGLEQGACGVIGQGCNVYPEILDAVGRAFGTGDRERAGRAQADVEQALRATDGVSAAVASKQYMARHGVQIGPDDRNGSAACPEDAMDRIAETWDVLRDRWRCERTSNVECPTNNTRIISDSAA